MKSSETKNHYATLQGLYIHIPFCVSKCDYCDFASYAGCSDLINPYLKALAKEARYYKNIFKPKTLYIGGGTPSLLAVKQIDFLCKAIENNFGEIKKFKELIFECNPESITEEKIKLLKNLGFTRLSIGMQAMTDKHLKIIGRAHNKKQFLAAYNTARKYFDNLNIDIIAALPEQTLQDFKSTLAQAAALGPEHISLYGLQVEEGTKLHKSGFISDDNLCRKMIEFAQDFLHAKNYIHYEISNYARNGKESLHNINYWKNGQYLGLGAAAASYINGTRRANTTDIKEYISRLLRQGQSSFPRNGGLPFVAFSEKLTGKKKEGEKIMLGLRMLKGINLSAKAQKLFADDFKDLAERGLITKNENKVYLSKEGFFMANEVFRRFVEPFS
jgi:oxygen-independent coproporphyrinogen-3 oxidase